MTQKVKAMYVLVRAFLVGIVALLLVCGCTGKGDDDKQATHNRAPHFVVQDLRGKTLRLEDLRGKVVLLNFFATWCGPCRREIGELVKLYEKFRERGLEVVGVSLDMEGAAVLPPFVKHYNITYPVVIGTRKMVVDYGGISGVPTSFIIDRDGMIAEHFVGLRPAQVLEASVVELLKAKVARAQES
ncbi:MAG: TlpA disulfide reductase family protein [Thermodesulfobacteriota bacterium]|nr:TlpA disulfide reductase family protein [Thermodesulfobacteriota bacterium]